MLKQDRGKTIIEGNVSDVINELAVLTLHIKNDCLKAGVTKDEFAEAIALSTSAQLMAQAGMTIEEVEEVLDMPIDREKSCYEKDERELHESERNNHE